ncbi:protein NRT1/ PTR FAMILY 5.10-like protein [Carex littledalei]|uniref:Protein NRT1/ PTR FAMILY 5.10-like protein n=1 Tax=Carex littledalei TaxID=544730 RepID=A0A833R7T2_9POAL|nr:protein NRT1/ PTR FAMILY 5.10-like protein [Carex littledalei]
MDPDPLLEQSEPLIGVVDYRGRPVVSRAFSGGWRAAFFVLGLETILRFAYYGISSNLISYMTESLGQSNASAAAAVNAWSGTSSMLPLLGAFLADSFLGRYRTIVISSFLYIIGYGMLTLSAVLPYMRPPTCTDGATTDSATCQPSSFQLAFFYISLYVVAFAQGGDKPCGVAFGADQFDPNDPKECIYRSSFFNWWYFCMAIGISVAVVVLSYVEDNVGWGLGFGIPCLIMVVCLVVFLAGSTRYRLYNPSGTSPFVRIGSSFVLLLRSWRASYGPVEARREVIETKSFAMEESGCEDSTEKRIEEAKGVLQLLPIWMTCLIYGTVFAQISTLFNKQAKTLDRSITSSLELPPAAIQSVGSMAIMAFVPVYDRILVPVARKFTKHPTGITMLQRIGIGMVISALTVVVSALVETKRLKTAQDFDLVDQPNATIPMSWWWMVPQYLLIGIGDVFTIVGLQEFFYDQMPIHFRTLGLALYLSVLGIGSFISSFLISLIDKITSENGDSWFSNNLNRAHLDYFYWLLAFLSIIELGLFLYFAKGYVYKRKCL